LKTKTTTDLATAASQAALAESKLPPSIVDETFFGNCIQSSPDAAYLARHVALRCGTPIENPAMTINRLCGSGFETVCLVKPIDLIFAL
jgi:acetyl-CoA acyltransferase 2